jgi:hypothetical protein
VTVPDLPVVEAKHAAVMAAIRRRTPEGCDCLACRRSPCDRALANRALARLRRHRHDLFRGWGDNGCRVCGHGESGDGWPCPDALDAWTDLTDIGATYGVKL